MPERGLENIIKSILDEAAQNEQDLILKAQAKADKILKEARAKAAALAKEKVIRSEKEILNLKSRVKSLANIKLRDGIVNAKIDIIKDVINKARNEICNLPDEEYFNVILRISRPCFINGKKGEVLFSGKDLSRLSKSSILKFLDSAKKFGTVLEVSKDVLDDNTSGVILRYSNIEENCTIDALFKEKYTEILSSLSSVLFGEVA